LQTSDSPPHAYAGKGQNVQLAPQIAKAFSLLLELPEMIGTIDAGRRHPETGAVSKFAVPTL
jgi:hypothetical protein